MPKTKDGGFILDDRDFQYPLLPNTSKKTVKKTVKKVTKKKK